MSGYKVVAPLVIAEDQAGKLHHVYEGGVIPWLSDRQAEHFVSEGLVEEVGADVGPVVAVLEPGYVAPVPGVDPVSPLGDPEDARPLRAASKAEWVDYAVSKGADPEEAAALSKVELVELYGG